MDASISLVTVTRTVTTGSVSIVETASAPLPEARALLGTVGESARAGYLVAALFEALPSVKPLPSVHGKN